MRPVHALLLAARHCRDRRRPRPRTTPVTFIDTSMGLLSPTAPGTPSIRTSRQGVTTPQGNSSVMLTGPAATTSGLLAFPNMFGTGTGQIPIGSSIHNAVLDLTTPNASTNGQVSIYLATSPWTEGTVWDPTKPNGGVNFNPIPIASAVQANDGTTVFDVTAAVDAWAARHPELRAGRQDGGRHLGGVQHE